MWTARIKNSRLVRRFLGLRERLWIRPLIYVVSAVLAALLAHLADMLFPVGDLVVPDIAIETIERLLTIISTSMLTVATFAAGSMVAAYGDASRSATPRAFRLALSDDMSQTALSSFLGAFIFASVGLVALRTGFYGVFGRLALFAMTVAIFARVVWTFVLWVDRIARLGRVGHMIETVEATARKSLAARRDDPVLGGTRADPADDAGGRGEALAAPSIGYVQWVDMSVLQSVAEAHDATIRLLVLPGAFVGPGGPVARIKGASSPMTAQDRTRLQGAFSIAHDRSFDHDPRFGLITLSEIAQRALSPAVNDPGTAIAIIGSCVRLLAGWGARNEPAAVRYDRVIVPELSISDMFEDAFSGIARDGASAPEVCLRLQKALAHLAAVPAPGFSAAARQMSAEALARASAALRLQADVAKVADAAARVG